MNEAQVVTAGNFAKFLRILADTTAESSEMSLEDYLCSLWVLIQENYDTPVSYGLLAQMLSNAFTTQPAPFDNSWLDYTSPPLELEEDPTMVEDDYEFVKNTILYQIADLHKMKEAMYFDRPPMILYLGVDSPTGNRWYNFHPASFLRCASSSMIKESEVTECNWSNFAIVLWVGQIYE